MISDLEVIWGRKEHGCGVQGSRTAIYWSEGKSEKGGENKGRILKNWGNRENVRKGTQVEGDGGSKLTNKK